MIDGEVQMSNIIVEILDARTEAFIQEVKDASSRFVAEKVKDALFLDSDRYGVDAEGRRVKIYLNRSQILDRAFKAATGSTIDQFIQNLPFGVRHFTGVLRSRIENMVATQVIGKLSGLAVGKTVEKILLQGYGHAKQAIADRIDARYETEADSNPHLDAVLNETDLQAVIAITTSIDPVEAPVLASPASTVVPAVEIKGLSEQDNQQSIALKDVIGRCEYQLKCYLNGLAQDVTAYGVKKGLRTVTEEAMVRTFDYSSAAVSTAGAAATLAGANPAFGILGITATQMANLTKPYAVKTAGNKAEAKAEEWIKQSDLYQREFFNLEHEKSGQYKVTVQKDEESLLDDDNEFEMVDHRDYSFTEWAKDKKHQVVDFVEKVTETLRQLDSYFVRKAEERTSSIPAVSSGWTSWFRDNDIEKLVKIREQYVACEKKLIVLELKLMEATEYARGQRESITVEGLQQRRENIALYTEEARKVKLEMQTAVAKIDRVENAARKAEVVTQGEKVISQLSKNLTALSNDLPKLLDEAMPTVRHNRVVAR